MPRSISVTYRCNRCGREETHLHGGSLADLDAMMRSYWWRVKQSGQNVLCPACVTYLALTG